MSPGDMKIGQSFNLLFVCVALLKYMRKHNYHPNLKPNTGHSVICIKFSYVSFSRMDVTTIAMNTTITEDINRDLTNNDDVMVVAERMHYISSSFAGTIFLIFGLAGNILSLIIWCKKSKISSTEMYLIAQSITDIGVLVLFFLTDSLIMIQPSIKESYTYGVFYSYIGYPLFYFFVVNSIWNLVGVTVDRYINVCWYQQAKVSKSYFGWYLDSFEV